MTKLYMSDRDKVSNTTKKAGKRSHGMDKTTEVKEYFQLYHTLFTDPIRVCIGVPLRLYSISYCISRAGIIEY